MSGSLQSLNGTEIAALVLIAQSHGIRTQARRSARAMKKAFDTAQSGAKSAESGARMFGHFDDCGSEYSDEHAKASAGFATVKPLFETAVAAEIAAEKEYTRIKHEMLERHPAIEAHVDSLILTSHAMAAEAAAQRDWATDKSAAAVVVACLRPAARR